MSSALAPQVPLKFVGRIVSGGTPSSETANWGGDLPFVTPPDLNGLDGAPITSGDRPHGTGGVRIIRGA